MNEVKDPGLIVLAIVKLAPYIITMIVDSVDVAFRLPKKRPTTHYPRLGRNDLPSKPCYLTNAI